MTIKVIGAGFGRTGTLSLKHALEQLGFARCYHMEEVFGHPEHTAYWAALNRGEDIDWNALFDGYQASVDWPSCNFWREQLQRYPGAKVVLSIRDPESWYRSIMNTIYPTSLQARDSEDATTARLGAWLFDVVWQRVFDGRLEDREHCLKIFRAHEATLRKEVPSEQLLVFQAADGWEPLCRFLQCDVPEDSYPRVNTTREFQARSAERTHETAPES